MPETPQKILVAVAWPYASGPRHLGHVAGPGVPSDIFARYHRLKGNDVLMVSGTDEHGTPVMVSADREGVTPRELADRNNALDPRRLRPPRHVVRLLHADDDAQPLRVVQDMFRTLYEKGYLIEQTTLGAISADDRPHAPRPLHRGDVPDLRLRRGARRPVRQLRQPARPGRPDRPALDSRRHDAGVPRDDAPLPRPARVRASGSSSGSRRRRTGGRTSATSRSTSLEEVEAAADDPRPRLGRSGPGRRLPRGRRKRIYVWFDAVIGYLSASRRVGAQRRHARGVARVVAEPGRAQLLLHGQGQHRLPHGHLAVDADGLGGGDGRHLQLPYNVVSSEYLTMSGSKVSTSRGHAIWVKDFLDRYEPDPLRYYLTAAGPETQDTRLHVGGVRPPHERRAGRQLGQPRQPDARERAPELRRGARARRADRGRPRAPRRGRAGIRRRSASTSRTPASGPPRPRRWRRARSRTSTSPTRRRGRS